MPRLFENIDKFKKKTALIGLNSEEVTYGQILNINKKINYKIFSRSIILMIGTNTINSVIGYISFIKNNHIVILLDNNLSKIYIKNIIKKYNPNYIYAPKNFFKKYYYKKILDFSDYEILKTNYKKNVKVNYLNKVLLTTSGTTQNPKMVRLSNSNLYSNTKSIIEYLNIKSNHTTITTMPMAYSYGLSIINSHIHAGSRIILSDKTLFDKIFWELISKFQVTSFGGVPSFYKILKRLKIENMNLESIKYVTQAGGKLDIDTAKNLSKIFKFKKIQFFIMYGQTEASPRMSYLNPNMIDRHPNSIGKPLKKSSFEIIDEKGKKIKESFKEGEIVFFGKNVSLGYAESIKDLYKGDINKKKLFTGDLGMRNKEGFYFLTGRKNRFIKISGFRINLEDIEKFLKIKKNLLSVSLSDNKLEILSIKKLNFTKIKEKIHKKFKIRQNDILIKLVNNRENTNFKS